MCQDYIVSPDQADKLLSAGITPWLGDIMFMSVEDLAAATRDCDVVVFSAGAAGSGPERTTAIDGEGVIKTVHAARANGIARVYLVSAFMDAGRAQPRKDWLRALYESEETGRQCFGSIGIRLGHSAPRNACQ